MAVTRQWTTRRYRRTARGEAPNNAEVAAQIDAGPPGRDL
jgi:hypothetical protein